MLSKPVFWLPKRAAGQPLVSSIPTYGKVYNLGSPADLMEMTKRENPIIFMPHPRSKGSTGYPDAIKDYAHFLARELPRHSGIAGAWASMPPRRGSASIRCLGALRRDEQLDVGPPLPLKFMQAISEARSDIGERGKPPYDDTYGMSRSIT